MNKKKSPSCGSSQTKKKKVWEYTIIFNHITFCYANK